MHCLGNTCFQRFEVLILRDKVEPKKARGRSKGRWMKWKVSRKRWKLLVEMIRLKWKLEELN